MTPGSRSSSGAEDKRAVPRSARAAAPGSGAASPGIRLRSQERRCVPWSGAAFPGAGLHPRSDAVSPGTRFHPRNQAATRRIGLHPPPLVRQCPWEPGCFPGAGYFPRAGLRPQESGCIPGARCFPRTGLQSRCRPPAVQGAGRALTFLLELQLLQHAGFRGSRGRRQRRLRGRRRTRISMGRGDPASLAPGGGACSGDGRARQRARAAG